jgi:hypothetical protein
MKDQPLIFRPGILLRAEALLVLFAACAAYNHWFPHHWVLFACLFLVPDLSLIFYLRGSGSEASIVYNSFHSYMLPALMGAISLHTGTVFFEEASLIWISHIGLDRTLGYGLKYSTSFAFTHIQGAASARPQPDR